MISRDGRMRCDDMRLQFMGPAAFSDETRRVFGSRDLFRIQTK